MADLYGDDSDLGFARKYRPKSIAGYVGNKKVKDSIMLYLKNKKPQSILLYGDTGCGKTTMARLIAKEYLCYERDAEKGACNECDMCFAVDEYIERGGFGDIPNILEIDVTGKGGKKDIDAVLQGVDLPLFGNGWKIYIFDEIQVAGEQAQSRLLKVLEEPPENVLFIFCTTNPEKILDTVKNRCQLKLKVSRPSTPELTDLLERVCLNEGKDCDLQGLRIVAGRSNNIIRDSLGNLEKLINIYGNAKAESASKEFDEVSDEIMFDFYKAYIEKDEMAYINVLYKVKCEFDFGQFLTSLTNFTTRGIYIINGKNLDGLSEGELVSYKNLFKQFDSKELFGTLSKLLKLGSGDVEANLITFIYDYDEPKTVIVQGQKEEGISSVDPIAKETKARNNNLKILEQHKLKKGMDSLSGLEEKADLFEMANLFKLEKVSTDNL